MAFGNCETPWKSVWIMDSITKDFDIRNLAKHVGVILSRSEPLMLKLRISSKNSKAHPNFLQQMMRGLHSESWLELLTLRLDIGSISPRVFFDVPSGFFDCLGTTSLFVESIPLRLMELLHWKLQVICGNSSSHPKESKTSCLGNKLALWPTL